MGQARARGTYEERVEQALAIKAAQAMYHLELETEAQERRRIRANQEIEAWNTMVWWQVDMTLERMGQIERRRRSGISSLAALYGMVCSMDAVHPYGRLSR